MKRSVATCCQGDSGTGVGMRGSLFGLHTGTLGAFLDEIDQLLGRRGHHTAELALRRAPYHTLISVMQLLYKLVSRFGVP